MEYKSNQKVWESYDVRQKAMACVISLSLSSLHVQETLKMRNSCMCDRRSEGGYEGVREDVGYKDVLSVNAI